MHTMTVFVAPDADSIHIEIEDPLPMFGSHVERETVFDVTAERLSKALLASLPQGIVERVALRLVAASVTEPVTVPVCWAETGYATTASVAASATALPMAVTNLFITLPLDLEGYEMPAATRRPPGRHVQANN